MTVSIIVLTHNNELTIEAVLKSLLSQEGINNTEILIIDDCSTDRTVEICNRFGVPIIRNKRNMGLAHNLNLGFKLAKHNIVITLEGDTIPIGSQWLKELIKPLDHPDVAASCSLQFPPDDAIGNLCLWEKLHWARIKPHHALNVKADAFKKDVLMDLGLFDEEHFRMGGEDADMATRLKLKGWKIEGTAAKVIHQHRFDQNFHRRCFLAILKLAFNYGVMNGVHRRKYPFLIPRNYMFPNDNSFQFNDGLFVTMICIGCFIPYIQLFAIPLLIISLFIGIRQVISKIGLKGLLYPLFRFLCICFFVAGYCWGIIVGKTKIDTNVKRMPRNHAIC